MNGYPKDLRLKVLDALDRGTPRREAARLLGVYLSTIKRYLKRRREGEDLSRRGPRRGAPRASSPPRRITPFAVAFKALTTAERVGGSSIFWHTSEGEYLYDRCY